MGISMVGSYRVQPYRLRYYPIYSYASSMGPVYFEGSTNGGLNYTVLATLKTSKEGWNYVTATGPQAKSWYTHLRYHAVSDASSSTTYFHCPLAEIKFLGTVASRDNICSVKVWNGRRLFYPGRMNYRCDTPPLSPTASLPPI